MNAGQLTWKHALGVAAVVFVVAYAALAVWNAHGHAMPQNSWIAVGVVVVMAAMVLFAGNEIRIYLKGESTRPPSPQRSRSTLVAAQACILAGAAFAGWYAGTAAVDAGRMQTTTGPSSFLLAVVLIVVCVALVVSGLVVQWWCKLPEDDEDKKRRTPKGPPGEVV
ncbi:DUF3180 family protein [Allobranchiibius huperziae]|uniref:Uncharacterized membrane protein YidH (DUF202 family) n=1 Tax=Allobranchiibius huperziae TaxID=1874116 RepID=A0A853D930_9MICO|nr:uncharacterized membrane protein YidH (DUF202 family) [Allobranchiibius huperziae]